MNEPVRCECERGKVVILHDGSECCTATIQRYEALHGPFPWAYEMKREVGNVPES